MQARLACPAGELHAIVGTSGAGKTTLLKAIAGLSRSCSGTITCNGTAWLESDRRHFVSPQDRRVGLVFQNYALFPHMNACANVASAIDHGTPKEKTARADDLLNQVALPDFGPRRIATLSGGEQQRVAVARALAREPAILLLDEPFSAVDRMTRRRLQADLAALRQSLNIPILLVTHDIDEALGLADLITVMHRGETLQTASPAEIMANPANETVAAILGVEG
jgi:molybdate transport system ATP-binding protein